MRVPSAAMLNLTCTAYQEINGFDTVNAPVKTKALLYSTIPCRSRLLSGSEVNANGSERARSTNRLYVPYAPYPAINTASRITMVNGTEWDVINANNVDNQGLIWEVDIRQANLGNAEVAWIINPVSPELSITATVTDVGIFTSAGFTTVMINDQASNSLIPIYLGPATGTADPLNIFYGTTQYAGMFAKTYHITVTINNTVYWMPVYSWDNLVGGGCTSFTGTVAIGGTFTSVGFVKTYLNGMTTTVWVPLYDRT